MDFGIHLIRPPDTVDTACFVSQDLRAGFDKLMQVLCAGFVSKLAGYVCRLCT